MTQPHEIAGADQELATANTMVDELITAWQQQQATHPDPDRTNTIGMFMVAEITPRLGTGFGPAAALVIAIERLARP